MLQFICSILYVRDKHIEKGFVADGPITLTVDLVRDYLTEHDVIGQGGLHFPPGVYPYVTYGNYTINFYWDSLKSRFVIRHNCINEKQAHIILLKFLNVEMEDRENK